MEYFTMSTDAMCQNSQLCKPVLAGDDDNQEEESDDDDNGREYNHEFAYYKD